MKYARIVNNRAVDVRTESPECCFTPDIVAQFVTVPDQVEDGWILNGETWEALPAPAIPDPVEPVVIPPKVGPIKFKMLFSSAERVKARQLRESDPVLDDFWQLIDDTRTDEVDMSLESVQDAIEYTLTVVSNAGVSLDVNSRKAAILTGELS